MSHIEKEKLIKADIVSIENRVRHAFNQGYDLGFKDGKERAKPLEQEPFKPMVEIDLYSVIRQKYIEREVLDKIRIEIEKAVWEDVVVSLDGTDEVRIPRLDPDDVFEIIDKYKAESEKT